MSKRSTQHATSHKLFAHHLHSSISRYTEAGAARLQTLTDQGDFRQAAEALQAAKSLQQSFHTFQNVERVSTVWRQISQSQEQLKTAAMEQYEK